MIGQFSVSKANVIADEEARGGDSTLEVLSFVSQMSREDGTSCRISSPS